MSFFKIMKPGTATILSAVLLFVVIASIFFSLVFTVGKEKVNQFLADVSCFSARILHTIFKEFYNHLMFSVRKDEK